MICVARPSFGGTSQSLGRWRGLHAFYLYIGLYTVGL